MSYPRCRDNIWDNRSPIGVQPRWKMDNDNYGEPSSLSGPWYFDGYRSCVYYRQPSGRHNCSEQESNLYLLTQAKRP